jgi:glycerol-3-phosphate dehydrogenase
MFVLPAGRLTIIGTTESDEIADPDEVRATSADIEYLLSSVNAAFPRAQLDRIDVVSAWAGIRPLAASGHPSDAASASREHEIERAASGMVTVTGGKLTTYRAMAAEVVDTVLADLDRPVVPTTTHLVRLPGRERAAAVDALASADAQLSERLDPQLPYRFADIVYGVECEQAFTLSDLLMRRTHVAFETRDAGVAVSPRVADVVAALLDWDPDAKQRAIDDYARDAQRVFAWDDATTPDGSSEAPRSSGGV